MGDNMVRWPRVKQILDEAMDRWEQRQGRRGLPGIHGYRWSTPQELARDSAMGMRFVEPGVPAEQTALVRSLRTGFGSIPKMPMNGPFLKEEQIQEIVDWIDSGMPE